MKAYLFRRNLWRHYYSGKAFDPFASRTDFPTLEKGGVGVVWSALHLPEQRFFKECFALGAAAFLAIPVYLRIMRGDRMKRLLEMMDVMEKEIRRRPERTELATSVAEVDRIRRDGKIAFVHTVEGAHVLSEGDPERDIEILAQRGVAMITLTHFYANGIATPADGVPNDNFVKRACSFNFGLSTTPALTDRGKTVIRKMIAERIIVDITHCNPTARQAAYAEVARTVPIVASHVGVQRYRNDPYNLTDDEIQEIQASGGLVGVIFMPYWLSSDPADHHAGLPILWKTIEHIFTVTGSWDHVALGTDFDGFTDPPDDLPDAGALGAVTRLLHDRGVPEDGIRKILGGNALRVLRAGWR